MKREIEILWRLTDSADRAVDALRRLEDHGSTRTRDIYFFDPKRSALKPVAGRLTECFRLRRRGDRASLAYKVDHFRGDIWSHSDEFEVEVSDFETALHIVSRLGFEPLVEVDMIKHRFSSDDFDVAVEEVGGLGDFIEVESRRAVEEHAVEEERARIRRFLDGFGLKLGEELNAGKPELLLRKRAAGHPA